MHRKDEKNKVENKLREALRSSLSDLGIGKIVIRAQVQVPTGTKRLPIKTKSYGKLPANTPEAHQLKSRAPYLTQFSKGIRSLQQLQQHLLQLQSDKI